MPTHPLISYMESPDGPGQDVLSDGSASMPGAGSSSSSSVTEKTVPLVDCMFCEQTFQHQDELSPHVLTQHPTTLFGPAVLRVEAAFRSPGERARAPEREDGAGCAVCGQALEGGAAELEAHMRRHKDSFIYSCNLCGRRFKEPWFLKNHMRTHAGKAGARGKGQQDPDTPATVNDVVQGPAAGPVGSPYRMCMVCGFFFPSKEVLAEHSKVHHREPEPGEDQGPSPDSLTAPEAPLSQESFLELVGLHAQASGKTHPPGTSAKWITQLDPFNTYQAWQLATKGKIAVGPGLAKEPGPDGSSDNEDSGSDKEELGEIWSAGRGAGPKSIEEGFRRDLKSKRAGGETPSPEPSPEPNHKTLTSKDKPTNCSDCGKTFRTYHQLVLHSRVHKKDSPSGASSEGRRASVGEGGVLDRAEECSEDGSEEGGPGDAFHSDKSEDCFDSSKLKILAPSKECSYCGKSFRSNYYLNIHLRTHTGEKPYKCEYCDYAAAQKTSLRYHLDRRHKDMPEAGHSGKLASASPPPGEAKELPRNGDGKHVARQSKSWPAPSTGVGNAADGADGKGAGQLSRDFSAKPEHGRTAAAALGPPSGGAEDLAKPAVAAPVQAKVEGGKVEESLSETPLNLSCRGSLPVSATSMPKSPVITNACPLCAYKTLYPEVLLMHKRLLHKEKPDGTRKSAPRGPAGALRQKRNTGCPPALGGKDVAPLPLYYRKHPRRTKSPAPAHPGQAPKLPAQRHRTPDGPSVREGARVPAERQPEPGGHGRKDVPFTSVKPNHPDAEGPGTRGRPTRPCFSNRFSSLPQVDLGEPSTKRLKQSETPADGYIRLVPKAPLPISSPSRGPHSFGPVPSTPPPCVADADWSVINILRSYSPSDLASLYQPAGLGSTHRAGPGPGPASAAGNRPLLYQHYPTSMLSRRHSLGPVSNTRCGPADKNT